MKKIIFILSLVLLSSCISKEQKEAAQLDTQQFEDFGSISNIDARTLTYRGHSYIIWNVSRGGSAIHDPDCPCHKDNYVKLD